MEFGESTGPSTDRHNDPVIDPTENVKALNEAANKRQDDLRQELEKHLNLAIGELAVRVDREFALVESRRVEQKVDTKVAVDAALNAAKEAVKEQTAASDKSILKAETNASEQSKQQNATFTQALKGVTDTVSDLKERLIAIESARVSGREGSHDRYEATNASTNVLLVVAAFVSIAVIVLGAIIAAHGFK